MTTPDKAGEDLGEGCSASRDPQDRPSGSRDEADAPATAALAPIGDALRSRLHDYAMFASTLGPRRALLDVYGNDAMEMARDVMTAIAPRAAASTTPASGNEEVAAEVAQPIRKATWKLVPVDDGARSFSDSGLPRAMIDAGLAVCDQRDNDNMNYVAGVTTDWDDGMVCVAIYRAMVATSPSPEIPDNMVERAARELALLQFEEGRAPGGYMHLDDDLTAEAAAYVEASWVHFEPEARRVLAVALTAALTPKEA